MNTTKNISFIAGIGAIAATGVHRLRWDDATHLNNVARNSRLLQFSLFIAGALLLLAGSEQLASAQGMVATYNDVRVANAVNALFLYIEGTFGALVMVAAGLAAILSAAFGQYRAALGLLVVAIGAFILRSVLSTFFNDQSIQA